MTERQGLRKPISLWVPSQNGLIRDLPHLHRATVDRRASILCPSASRSSNAPRTSSGPSRYGVMTTGLRGFTLIPALVLLRYPVGSRCKQAVTVDRAKPKEMSVLIALIVLLLVLALVGGLVVHPLLFLIALLAVLVLFGGRRHAL